MNSFKNIEPIQLIKKILSNRTRSVPSIMKNSTNLIKNKQQRLQNKNYKLMPLHLLDKKKLFNNNINRSSGNIIQSKELQSILEKKQKLQIKKIKTINPLTSLNKNNSVILPDINFIKKKSSNKNNRNNSILSTSLDMYFNYLKTTSDNPQKEGNVMNDEELVLLLNAKCKDIGIDFRENIFLKFKEFCNAKCKNRIVELCQCCLGLNSIRVISLLLLDTNRISRLDLARNNIGNEGVEILVNSLKNTKSLVYLNIASNLITYRGGQLIFNSFVNQQSIVDLNLSSYECSNRNRLTSVGIGNISEYLNINYFIETLSLAGNGIRNEGFLYICHGLEKNLSLLNLDIGNNGINEKGIKKGIEFISSSKIYTKINNLNISNNRILNSGMILLASNFRYFPNITSLNISYCGIEFKGFQKLLKSLPSLRKLENLNVSGNNLKSNNFFILKDQFSAFSVRYLNMSRCELGDKSAFYLGECISSNESLKYLNISGNNISDPGFKGFSNIFKFNKSIESFDCSCNFITDITGREFIKSLFNNMNIKSINFYDNQLHDDVAADIISLIEQNENLIHFNLSGNRVQTKTIEDINKKLKINYDKRKINLVPEIERNIRELEVRPEQLQNLAKIITEKKNYLKTSYKKLNEDRKNFEISLDKLDINLKNQNDILEKLMEDKKVLEGQLNNVVNETNNFGINANKEENRKKDKIQEEINMLADIKKENEELLRQYNLKKKQIDEKIQKVEKKFKLSLDRYNLAKNDYEAKDREYINKFKYYQQLLDPSLFQKIEKIEIKEENENKNLEKLKGSKNKINQNKRNKKNIQKNANNNLYSMTTLSTGNNGNFNVNPQEKKSFKFNKNK